MYSQVQLVFSIWQPPLGNGLDTSWASKDEVSMVGIGEKRGHSGLTCHMFLE